MRSIPPESLGQGSDTGAEGEIIRGASRRSPSHAWCQGTHTSLLSLWHQGQGLSEELLQHLPPKIQSLPKLHSFTCYGTYKMK